jgi:hypothetical protein
MNDTELLQAIRQIVKDEVNPVKQDVTSIKGVLSDLKAGQLKINVTLENEIGLKLSALFDAHQLDSEKIQSIKDTVEAIEEVVDADDTLAKINARDIRKLKEKLG